MPFTRDQTEDINKLISESIRAIVNSQDFIESIVVAVSTVIIGSVEDQLNNMKSKIEKLERDNESLSRENTKLANLVENINSTNRKKNIRILGVKEMAGEKPIAVVLKLFKETMKLNITEESIDQVYRIGKKREDKPRPVLVQFSNVKNRNSVFYEKKILKGTKVVILEDLTHQQTMCYKRAADIYTNKNVWTRNGRIYVKTGGQVKHFDGQEATGVQTSEVATEV